MVKNLVIAIPDQCQETWIAAAANCGFKNVELSWQAFTDKELFTKIDDAGLSIAAVRELMPLEMTRNLSDLSVSMRNQAFSAVEKRLSGLDKNGVRNAVLDLGVRYTAGADREDAGLVRKIEFARRLMEAATTHEIKLCLQARYPRAYPAAPQWEIVGRIIHEVMNPNCGLAIDLVPGEMSAEEFDVRQFLRKCVYHLRVLRMHFEPGLGEELDPRFLSAWSEVLAGYLYKGLVVFCPGRGVSKRKIEETTEDLKLWAESFS